MSVSKKSSFINPEFRSGVRRFRKLQQDFISPLLILISVAASVLTGLVFGLYPASGAAAKNPVEALSNE